MRNQPKRHPDLLRQRAKLGAGAAPNGQARFRLARSVQRKGTSTMRRKTRGLWAQTGPVWGNDHQFLRRGAPTRPQPCADNDPNCMWDTGLRLRGRNPDEEAMWDVANSPVRPTSRQGPRGRWQAAGPRRNGACPPGQVVCGTSLPGQPPICCPRAEIGVRAAYLESTRRPASRWAAAGPRRNAGCPPGQVVCGTSLPGHPPICCPKPPGGGGTHQQLAVAFQQQMTSTGGCVPSSWPCKPGHGKCNAGSFHGQNLPGCRPMTLSSRPKQQHSRRPTGRGSTLRAIASGRARR